MMRMKVTAKKKETKTRKRRSEALKVPDSFFFYPCE